MKKYKNTVQTAVLFLGMLTLMLALGYLLTGSLQGLIWAGLLSGGMLVMTLRMPTRVIMRMYRARELSPGEAPQLSRVMEILSRRANLPRAPRLYFIPNRMINAFASGGRRDPAIAVTYGLLSQLNIRELTGVLAHEISHIRNNDFRLKGFVAIMGRLTRLFSIFGQILLFVNLPLYLMGEATLPWAGVLLLIMAPVLSTLMMSAISRVREREADIAAAHLTGDPNGLADALLKLNYLNNGGILERMIPRTLNSHPQTRERVRQLRELAPSLSPQIEFPESPWVSLEAPGVRRSGWWV